MRTMRRAVAVAMVAGAVTVSTAVAAEAAPARIATGAAAATHRRPVFNRNFADPVVRWTGSRYVGVATGKRGPLATAPTARGPWTYRHPALTRLPRWSTGSGGIWAPQLQHVRGKRWVLFFAARVSGLPHDNQRCIGVAVSTHGAAGKYHPVDKRPLVCPPGSNHPGASAPKTGGVGLIDPSTFTTKDHRHILLFKSQRPNPGTRLWSLRVGKNWTGPVGHAGVLIHRAKGQIENPHMVVRKHGYYLFASWNNWRDCSYRTVWLKNKRPRKGWSFPKRFPHASARGGTLVKSSKWVCGPGGLVVTRRNGKATFFLHAYRDADHDGKRDSNVRRLYAGRLSFAKGRPKIARFYQPA